MPNCDSVYWYFCATSIILRISFPHDIMQEGEGYHGIHVSDELISRMQFYTATVQQTQNIYITFINVGTTSSTLVQHCANAIQVCCVYWVVVLPNEQKECVVHKDALWTSLFNCVMFSIRLLWLIILTQLNFQTPWTPNSDTPRDIHSETVLMYISDH